MKRLRRRPYKDGELCMYWGRESRKDSPDVLIQRGKDVSSRDGHFIYGALCCQRERFNHSAGKFEFDPSFLDELKSRGYDITTLKFSIQKKTEPSP